MAVVAIGKDVSAVKRTTCYNCATVLEYTKNDIFRHKHSFDYLGDYSTDDAITCPNCNKPVIVS